MNIEPQHLDLEPRASDLIELLRDLGHLDEVAMDRLTAEIVGVNHGEHLVTFEEVRRAAAIVLFDGSANMRPEQRELMEAEWSRLFS